MSARRGILAVFCGIALAVAALVFQRVLESTMARHMLLQIPMLIAAGACVALGLRRDAETSATASAAACTASITSITSRLRSYDENGITGLFAFLLASAYWMIPKALDSAVLSVAMDAGKFLSLLLAGLLLPGSLSRANVIIQLFFIGNFASMTAIAGMLYQDTPRRLCNLYLLDDQLVAGTGLVVLALLVPLAWGARQLANNRACADEESPAVLKPAA